MKLMKKLVATTLSLGLALSLAVVTKAEETHKVTLHGEVTDAGQVVSKMTINYGENVTVSGVDTDTFTVHAKADTSAYRTEDVSSYGDYDIDRTIVKVEAEGSEVTVYFLESEGAKLAYLSSARNFPADLTYTITQNEPITLTAKDGRETSHTATYTWDGVVVDEETAKFESVIVEDGINYQFHEEEGADALIVWFHGNGEGDYNGSNNNVSQMLANRGTVAWATDEAQEIFGKAHVMAFQAPDTWYYAQRDGLLAKAHDEIMAVVDKYDINPENILVSGCSAGGYMTTRMLIAYPDLFAAAMINCPALDVASARGGETPTDEELASLKNSSTAIWLVQGETDAAVQTAECSVRMWNILTEGMTTVKSTHEQEIASDFVTEETEDGKLKISLYATTENGKLQFAEDYNQDGELELVEYSNHWSWIYTLRNNPEDAKGVSIWEWAASYLTEAPVVTPEQPTQPTVPTVGITSNMAYAGVAALALVAVVALRKKED